MTKKNKIHNNNYLKDIFSHKNLETIWNNHKKHSKARGVDGVTPEQFRADLYKRLKKTSENLKKGQYKFQKLGFFTELKSDNKERVIVIPTVEDKLVQRVILDRLSTSKRPKLINDISYGSSKDKGVRAAVKEAIKKRNVKPWVLKTDICAFFDNIDRNELYKTLEKKLGRKKTLLLPLLKQIIQCEIRSTKIEKEHLEKNGIIEGKGLRQGMPLSPLLSNILLYNFDQNMTRKKADLIRYVDDIIVFCESETQCKDFKKVIQDQLLEVSLDLQDSKTEIKKPNEPVLFLGSEIFQNNNNRYDQRIPNKSIASARKKLNEYKKYDSELIRREKLDFKNTLNKVDNIVNGYLASYYKKAVNYESFKGNIEKTRKNIAESLLVSVLSEGIFESLSQDKKEFLGLKIKSDKKRK